MPLGPAGPPEIRPQEESQSEEKDGPKKVCVDLSNVVRAPQCPARRLVLAFSSAHVWQD